MFKPALFFIVTFKFNKKLASIRNTRKLALSGISAFLFINTLRTDISNAQDITSYQTIRYQQTIAQTNIYTCGAAAVSTLLTHFYQFPVDELEILEIAEKAMESSGKNPQVSGLTALALKHALIAKGIDADIRESQLEKLRTYFKRGGLPIVLHVTIPQPHYILAVDMVEDWIIVADPSLGRGLIPLNALKNQKGFSGIAIMPKPSQDFIRVARQQQQVSKDWAGERLRRFHTMKRTIL